MSTCQKPTSGLRPCDINCSKFFPAHFWSHNQKVVWVSLLYLHTKSNADYLHTNSTLILSQSLDSDHKTTRLRYQDKWGIFATTVVGFGVPPVYTIVPYLVSELDFTGICIKMSGKKNRALKKQN